MSDDLAAAAARFRAAALAAADALDEAVAALSQEKTVVNHYFDGYSPHAPDWPPAPAVAALREQRQQLGYPMGSGPAVEAMNAHQRSLRDKSCAHGAKRCMVLDCPEGWAPLGGGLMVATPDGWICPCGRNFEPFSGGRV